MRILLVGGGSGGSVAPLLAIAREIKNSHPKAKFLLVGSKFGPESHMASMAKVPFVYIPAGKLRRYFSLRNLFSPLQIMAGFYQSIRILKWFKPDCVFGAGSFIQVPLVWAARFLNIPLVLHQQDLLPSLANKFCQFAAQKITVTFEPTLRGFNSNLGLFYSKKPDKVVLTGNPFRQEIKEGSKEKAMEFFKLKAGLPTLLVLGGGTGAEFLNNTVFKAAGELTKTVQIIHSMGIGKFKDSNMENYHAYEFIDNMADAYAAADIVLARAGISTITELSYLKKVSIIVPMPDSHQELNGDYLERLQAALVFRQKILSSTRLIRIIRRLLFAYDTQKSMKERISEIIPHGANKKIAEIILKIAEKKNQ